MNDGRSEWPVCQRGRPRPALRSYTFPRDAGPGCAHGERVRHHRPEPDPPDPLGETGRRVRDRRVTAYGVTSGLVFFAYATVAEGIWRKTVGKTIAGLEVRAVAGPMTLGKAAVRNVPKLFWFLFPLLDTIAGLLVEGDPRQRFSDRILGTTVAQSSLIHVRLHRVGAPQ